MLKILNFIFFVIFGLFVILLINISFFSVDNNYNGEIDFNYNINTGSYINTINYLDNIYSFEKNNFHIEDIGDTIKINIGSGAFIVNINDVSKKYIITGSGFYVRPKAIGDIFINTTKKETLIFSINSVFSLDFLNSNQEKINSYFMYPHEWIKFNPKLNFIFKKSDLYRIRTTTKNGYFDDSISNIIKNSEKFSLFLGEKNLKLFESYVKNNNEILSRNNEIFKKIKLFKYKEIPFYDMINRYKIFFINDNKKLIFYKQEIYNNLLKLFNLTNTDNQEIIKNINLNLQLLKELNEQEYNHSLKLIDTFYKVVLLKRSLDTDIKLRNFLSLKDKVKYNKNYVFLNNLFYNFDFLSNEHFIKYFYLFLKDYIKDNIHNSLNIDKSIENESLVFLLQVFIKDTLFKNNLDNFYYEVKILSYYLQENEKLYFGNNDIRDKDIKIRTSLKQNKEILDKIALFLRNNFFELKREESSNLLILNDEINFDYNTFEQLENTINSIFNLFIINKNNLDKLEYKNLEKEFREYFLAIRDYKQYKIEYDVQLSDLYKEINIYNEIKTYTKNDIYNYLNQFEGLKFSFNNIVKQDGYFEIKHVFILNKQYTIKLYPYSGNKVELIGDDGSVKLTYFLDEAKEFLENKVGSVGLEDKHKYDFKYFFVNKLDSELSINNNGNIEDICRQLGKTVNQNYSENNGEPKCIANQENSIIFIFKDKVLLENKFKHLKNFLDIKYNNIILERVDKTYIVKFKNVAGIIKNNKNYSFEFSANYDFKNDFFENIKIKIIKNKKDKTYLYDGAVINIRYKKIQSENLEDFLKDYFINFNDSINTIYSSIRNNTYLDDIQIDIIGKTIHFRYLNSKGLNIKIKFEKDKILSIIKGNVNLLNRTININDIKFYINNIK